MTKIFERLRFERDAFMKHRGTPPKAMYITKNDVRDIATSILHEGNPYIIKDCGGINELANMMLTGDMEGKLSSFMGVPLKPVSWGYDK